MNVVGRQHEIKLMTDCLQDKEAHLMALIGRRRVGKTFLIRQVYKKHICFEMTGLKDADLQKQLTNFSLQLGLFFPDQEQTEIPENWLLAFNRLTKLISTSHSDKKRVVFFDELPWIAGKRSGFVEALAHWWNNWASQQNIVVVVCGSAASWMLQYVVNAKGGLHNRITKLIRLMPFTLAETKEYLQTKNIAYSHYQIIQIYMAIGGIPFYLKQLRRGLSAAQNIQQLCFEKDGFLRNEFGNLYHALFNNANYHVEVITALSKKASGLDRKAILAAVSMKDGGGFSKVLNELEASGFITSYQAFSKKKKDALYRLSDAYSLFFLKFIVVNNHLNADEWMQISNSQAYKIWCGYAFENLCFNHVNQIKKALGISGVYTSVNSFVHTANEKYDKGFQIDMLIDRKDETITICEMKFYADEFSISADYAKLIRNKVSGFKKLTKTKKMVQAAFVTTYGLKENPNKLDLVDHDFTIDVFFE